MVGDTHLARQREIADFVATRGQPDQSVVRSQLIAHGSLGPHIGAPFSRSQARRLLRQSGETQSTFESALVIYENFSRLPRAEQRVGVDLVRPFRPPGSHIGCVVVPGAVVDGGARDGSVDSKRARSRDVFENRITDQVLSAK